MKELTIEQKAKAYDEALKVLHKYDGAPIMFTQDLKEEMFPELRESEDERIRKALIRYFTLSDEHAYNEACGVSYRDIVAWLEKQGNANKEYWRGYREGKQEILDKYAELEKQGNNMGISEATKQELEDNLNKALEKETPESWNKFLEKQGEQKPAIIIPKFRVGDEIKTANEEPLTITKIDEKGYWSEDLFICGFDDAAKWEFVEQKHAWCKEDENLFKCAIDAVKQESKVRTDGCLDEEVGEMVINWLYSLKERYTWKPSDEQMSVIEAVINNRSFQRRLLVSLYEQLKKLRKE